MQKAFYFLIHVLQKLNYKFKELMICNILQTICQTLSLIINVLQSLSILQGMCPKEWMYLIKPLTLKLAIRGGEALPKGKMGLLASKRRLEMQLNLWLKDT